MLSKDKAGKYPVQVRYTPEEYESLRREAYEMKVTVNEFVRVVSLDYARASKINREQKE